ncbi:hypothetical protein H6H01_35950 [Nostoc calcicola FACHB-3891]|nr:hypothetical protein [Nostoc calcicola FACHB-3891]
MNSNLVSQMYIFRDVPDFVLEVKRTRSRSSCPYLIDNETNLSVISC